MTFLDVLSKLENLQVKLTVWAKLNRIMKFGLRDQLLSILESILTGERDEEIIGKIMETKFQLNWEIEKEEGHFGNKEYMLIGSNQVIRALHSFTNMLYSERE